MTASAAPLVPHEPRCSQSPLPRVVVDGHDHDCCRGELVHAELGRQQPPRREPRRPGVGTPAQLETTFLDQLLTLILMVTSDFADYFGVLPYFTIAAIGSATSVQEVAYTDVT